MRCRDKTNNPCITNRINTYQNEGKISYNRRKDHKNVVWYSFLKRKVLFFLFFFSPIKLFCRFSSPSWLWSRGLSREKSSSAEMSSYSFLHPYVYIISDLPNHYIRNPQVLSIYIFRSCSDSFEPLYFTFPPSGHSKASRKTPVCRLSEKNLQRGVADDGRDASVLMNSTFDTGFPWFSDVRGMCRWNFKKTDSLHKLIHMLWISCGLMFFFTCLTVKKMIPA